jgi:hypothetical protein
MEPRAVAAQRVGVAPDPVAVNSAIKVHYVCQLSMKAIAATTSITNGMVFPTIPGAAGFQSFRILKISLWGTDQSEAISGTSDPGGLTPVSLQLFAGAKTSGMTFSDFGTAGAHRACIGVLPDFDFRTTWIPVTASGSVALFNVVSTVNRSFVLNLSLELVTDSKSLPTVFVSSKVVESEELDDTATSLSNVRISEDKRPHCSPRALVLPGEVCLTCQTSPPGEHEVREN